MSAAPASLSGAAMAVIRRMQEADLAQVHAIDVLSFSLPWPEHSYRFELEENQAARCWVAEVQLPDGARPVAGIIVIWMIEDEAHIATIAVHPEYRGRGIGRMLLVEALRSVIKEGAAAATLEVRQSNDVAQALYRRFGFVEVGRRKRYYKDTNEDALIMTVDGLGVNYLRQMEMVP